MVDDEDAVVHDRAKKVLAKAAARRAARGAHGVGDQLHGSLWLHVHGKYQECMYVTDQRKTQVIGVLEDKLTFASRFFPIKAESLPSKDSKDPEKSEVGEVVLHHSHDGGSILGVHLGQLAFNQRYIPMTGG